ncbi:MAG: SNF2-related protein, partial [Deinococcota bacterium]|nr:SNF2-related protein [Deinococcota bacterium]
ELSYDPALPGFALPLEPGLYALQLQGLDPLSFRLSPAEEAVWPLQGEEQDGIKVQFSAQDPELLKQHAGDPARLELSKRAALLSTSYGFDKLISLPLLRDVDLFEHQTRAVLAVLRRFRGRAMLADEVGMGKTIEAGMVLLELVARKLARRVLVLTPPSLIEQWQRELSRKFGLDFVTHDDPDFKALGADAWSRHERIIASYHTAKRAPHKDAVTAQDWDLVIIDEAHHLRNRRTLTWQLANALRKKYILLLTATPLQNSLDEIFNLVTLLQPGLLGTSSNFQRRFVDSADHLSPRNIGELHGLLAEVMVRNRRATAQVRFTRRYAETLRVAPLAKEQRLYKEATERVKASLQGEKGGARISLLSLQRALGSSPWAAAQSLARLAERQPGFADLADLAQEIDASAKEARLLALLEDFPDKLVIFTQFRATQDHLYETLTEAGFEVALFHGGLTRMQKEAAVRSFAGSARMLLSTDSGSEGRNLQFCHGLVNFDLPWNPMRIEQRVGRLSRIGQSRDVHVFNLAGAGTLEEDILHLLEVKINLFELVMGEMDMILGNLDEEGEFETMIADLWLGSRDQPHFRERLDALG